MLLHTRHVARGAAMTVPKDHLRQLFADLTGAVCVWDGDPEPFQVSNGLCTLSVEALDEIGSDEYRQVFDVPTQKIVEIQVGQRLLKLGVRVQAIGASATPAYEALSGARTKLRRKSILARLNADQLALVTAGPVSDLTIVADNAEIYASHMTVNLSLAETDDRGATVLTYDKSAFAQPNALPAEDGNWIQTVNTTNTPTGTLT